MKKTKLTNLKKQNTNHLRKHVAAIHTNGVLSLLERKVVNVLLLNAYDSLLTQRTHSIPIKHLCEMIGWESSKNTDRLKDVLRELVSKPVEFNIMEDGEELWQVMSMISYGELKDGKCNYRYDEYLAERLYDPEIYATINMGIQKRFDGSYALTLYENCVRYKNVGSTGWWELDRFKQIIGATAEAYKEFKYLKRDVIVKSMKEINRISDIEIDVEYKKEGRKVSSVRFIVKENPQKILLQPIINEEHEAIRTKEIYKRLIEHGIGEKLAILWIIQDEERVSKIVKYVEEKDHNKKIKGSTAGYIRSLVEGDAQIEKSEYQKNKEQKERATLEKIEKERKKEKKINFDKEERRKKINEVINHLTNEEKKEWIQCYIDENGDNSAKSYDESENDFSNKLERLQFKGWLRIKIGEKL